MQKVLAIIHYVFYSYLEIAMSIAIVLLMLMSFVGIMILNGMTVKGNTTAYYVVSGIVFVLWAFLFGCIATVVVSA